MQLPASTRAVEWTSRAIYAPVLELRVKDPILYIGTGTTVVGGVTVRFGQYA
jgi:hypothetical protein